MGLYFESLEQVGYKARTVTNWVFFQAREKMDKKFPAAAGTISTAE